MVSNWLAGRSRPEAALSAGSAGQFALGREQERANLANQKAQNLMQGIISENARRSALAAQLGSLGAEEAARNAANQQAMTLGLIGTAAGFGGKFIPAPTPAKAGTLI
jgi:hypothetical protein